MYLYITITVPCLSDLGSFHTSPLDQDGDSLVSHPHSTMLGPLDQDGGSLVSHPPMLGPSSNETQWRQSNNTQGREVPNIQPTEKSQKPNKKSSQKATVVKHIVSICMVYLSYRTFLVTY